MSSSAPQLTIGVGTKASRHLMQHSANFPSVSGCGRFSRRSLCRATASFQTSSCLLARSCRSSMRFGAARRGRRRPRHPERRSAPRAFRERSRRQARGARRLVRALRARASARRGARAGARLQRRARARVPRARCACAAARRGGRRRLLRHRHAPASTKERTSRRSAASPAAASARALYARQAALSPSTATPAALFVAVPLARGRGDSSGRCARRRASRARAGSPTRTGRRACTRGRGARRTANAPSTRLSTQLPSPDAGSSVQNRGTRWSAASRTAARSRSRRSRSLSRSARAANATSSQSSYAIECAAEARVPAAPVEERADDAELES